MTSDRNVAPSVRIQPASRARPSVHQTATRANEPSVSRSIVADHSTSVGHTASASPDTRAARGPNMRRATSMLSTTTAAPSAALTTRNALASATPPPAMEMAVVRPR